jgi:uncharacterized phage protein (TIGR01671 family)
MVYTDNNDYEIDVVDGQVFKESMTDHVGQDYVMQSTGLRDKNGVLIYEGDVLRPFNDVGVCVVNFRDGGFMVSNDQYIDVHIGRDYLNKCFYEVIGNIYQNPELVEGV